MTARLADNGGALMRPPLRLTLRLNLRVAASLLALLIASSPLAARADDAATAREHYQKGTSNYDLGRYADAIKEFEAAYEIKNDPALLYNLAQSHRLAGNTEQALHFYRTYLRYVPKAPNRAEIESRIAQLDQQLAQKNGATNTTPNVTPPPPSPTPPSATAPPSPTTTPEPITNSPYLVPAETPPAETPPTTVVPGAVEPEATTVMTAPPPASDRVRHAQLLKRVGLIGAAVGGGLFVIGAIEGLRAVQASNDINTLGKAHGTYDPSIQDRGKSAQAAEGVLLVLGALVAAGGGALYFYGRNQEQVAVTAVASSNQLGASLSVRF
jgi:tetratricopeptide (TPR) repeat protein